MGSDSNKDHTKERTSVNFDKSVVRNAKKDLSDNGYRSFSELCNALVKDWNSSGTHKRKTK